MLLLYSTLKAIFIPLTWDEIYTFEHYVKNGIIFLHQYNAIDANNHLLNTWLMELTYKLFGNSEWAMRLPNLIAQLVFLIYSGKLAMRLSTKVLTITAFLILNLNPFLNDYFILARGYGLSSGLLMMSLYFTYRYIEEKSSYSTAFIAVFTASITLLANFTLLNYALLLPLIFISINYYRTLRMPVDTSDSITNNKVSKLLFRINSILILIPLAVLLIAIPILIKLRNAKALIAGGDDGFFINTAVPLIQKSFNNTPIVVQGILFFEGIVIAIMILSFILILLKFKRDKTILTHSFFIVIFVMIIGCMVANILQHQWFGILYLKDRTALMYLPLFSILLICFLENVNVYLKRITAMFSVILCVVMLLNFIHGMSMVRVINHYWDTDLRDMIMYLKQHHKENTNDTKCLTIVVDRAFEEDLNNYKTIYTMDWLCKVDAADTLNPANDYFYISTNHLKLFDKNSYTILQTFPKTNMVLVKNTMPKNHSAMK